MVVDSSSAEVMLRRRNNLTAETLSPENSDKDSTASSDRNSSDGEFDTDVSTLNPIIAEELIETTQHLAHDAALEKLKEVGAKTPILPSEIGTDFNYKRQIVWPNAIGFIALHICALVGILMTMLGYSNYKTVIYSKWKPAKCFRKRIMKIIFRIFFLNCSAFVLMYGSGLGVTMGAHRLWSHRAFKAKTGLKIFLLWLHTLAGQVC